MKVVVGEPVSASTFRREGELPARAARRVTQWMLAYYGATEGDGTKHESQPEKSETATAPPMVSALS
jgi:hypothetical protein